MFYGLALISYIVDMIFGEFDIKHPVVYMGEYITWYTNRFYKDNVWSGFILTMTLLLITLIVTLGFVFIVNALVPAEHFKSINLTITSIIASTGIAGKILYESVKKVLTSNNPRDEIAMLVSRDTENMTDSDVYKACIETYAENLSDGVIAPLFYLMLFGLPGIALYKAVNTLDSMVGYKTRRYINFGRFSAKLDDVLNYIPSRITALLIFMVSRNKKAIESTLKYGKKHESPNAGYPISSMAGALGVALGGDTSYHGKIKHKPYFGSGRKEITKHDVYKMLNYKKQIDAMIMGGLCILFIITKLV